MSGIGDGHHRHRTRDGGSTSRSKATPSGSVKVARVTVMTQPRWTTSSPVGRNCGRSPSIRLGRSPAAGRSADGTDVDQTRVPALGPDQGGTDQLAEQRDGVGRAGS